jgi:hypothetical protein
MAICIPVCHIYRSRWWRFSVFCSALFRLILQPHSARSIAKEMLQWSVLAGYDDDEATAPATRTGAPWLQRQDKKRRKEGGHSTTILTNCDHFRIERSSASSEAQRSRIPGAVGASSAAAEAAPPPPPQYDERAASSASTASSGGDEEGTAR